MVNAQAISETGLLTDDQVMEVLTQGLGGKFAGQKVLVLIPDHTRSLPLPELFRMVVEVLHDVRELNVMVALGTHPGYSEEGLNHLVGISAEERRAFASLGYTDELLCEETGAPAASGEEGYTTLERMWARPTCDVNGITSGYGGQEIGRASCRERV